MEKKDPVARKPAASSLSAAAALMGKQRLSSMFTSSVFKKNGVRDDKVKGFSCDSIVDDVIAEFAPDEADREHRRRFHAIGRSALPISNVKIEKESFDSTNEIVNGDSMTLLRDASDGCAIDKVIIKESETGKDSHDHLPDKPITMSENCHPEKIIDDAELKAIEVKADLLVKDGVHTLNAKINEEKDSSLSATAGWKAVMSEGSGNIAGAADGIESCASGEEKSDFELDSNGSLPFYLMDAHEEIYGANMGNLYLFGKVNLVKMFSTFCFSIVELFYGGHGYRRRIVSETSFAFSSIQSKFMHITQF